MKVIKFSAEWCAPCAVFAKVMDAVSAEEEFKGIEFKTIDIESDEGVELASKYKVRNIPYTGIVNDKEEPLDVIVGSISKRAFEEKLREAKGKNNG